MKLVFEVYGENAFRQWTGAGFKKLLSPGLFDSLMQTFAVYAHRKNAEELKASRWSAAQLFVACRVGDAWRKALPAGSFSVARQLCGLNPLQPLVAFHCCLAPPHMCRT